MAALHRLSSWKIFIVMLVCTMNPFVLATNVTTFIDSEFITESEFPTEELFEAGLSKDFSNRQLFTSPLLAPAIRPPPPPPPPPPPFFSFPPSFSPAPIHHPQQIFQSHRPSVMGTPEDDDLVYYPYPYDGRNPWHQQLHSAQYGGKPIGRPSFRPFDVVDFPSKFPPTSFSPFSQLENGIEKPQGIHSLNGMHHFNNGEFIRPSIGTPPSTFNSFGSHSLEGLNPEFGVANSHVGSPFGGFSSHFTPQTINTQNHILGGIHSDGDLLGRPLSTLSQSPYRPIHVHELGGNKKPGITKPNAAFSGLTENGHKIINTLDPNFLAWALNRTKFGSKPVVVMVTGNKIPTSLLTDKPNLHSLFRTPEETMLHVDLDNSIIKSLTPESLQSLLHNLRRKKPFKPTMHKKPKVVPAEPPLFQPPFFDQSLGGLYEGPLEEPWEEMFGGPFDLFDIMPSLRPPEGLFNDWKVFTAKPNSEHLHPLGSLKDPVTLSRPTEARKTVGSVPALENKWLRYLLQRLFKPYQVTRKLVIAPRGLNPTDFLRRRLSTLVNGTAINNDKMDMDYSDGHAKEINHLTKDESKEDDDLPETMLDFNLRAVISPR